MEIRKMISEGTIPKNYNYAHVPLLQGNFINATHIQRGPDLINIHDQDEEQRKEDFKKSRMARQFEYELKLGKMTPTERDEKLAKDRKRLEEMKKSAEDINEPLSEKQVKEVWEKEDKMEKEAYSDLKFFRIHDVNEDGKWDQQELRQLLLRELSKVFDKKFESEGMEEEKIETLEWWREEVFKIADINKDGAIQMEEFINSKKSVLRTNWKKKLEEELEFLDEEIEKFKTKKE